MQKHLGQIFILLILGLILPRAIFAAEISFTAKTNTVVLNQQFQVDMALNTSGEPINAVQGNILFPSELLELKEIKDANSIVNFWIDKPKIESDGKIVFSGIIPGGYQGQNGLLLTLIFVSKKEGQGTVELREAKTLLNDGNGTEAQLTTPLYQFSAFQSASVPSLTASVIDKEPPESFMPEIARNSVIAGGKWFLVFATQDKGSGVDHYEIKETRQKILAIFAKWVVVENPYVLQDQELRSYVFVKAVDKDGNARVEQISPRNPLRWYENYGNWLIITLGFIIVLITPKFLWRRYSKK